MGATSMSQRYGLHKLFWWIPVGIVFHKNFYSIHYVSGPSMSPTFNPDPSVPRDIVLFDKLSVIHRSNKRGDVVALWSPSDPNLMITKRIVALEGDTVRTLPPYPDALVRVPRGHAWVEGDEPWKSRDSNQFGPVALGLFVAKINWIIWPLHRLGRVQNHPHGALPMSGLPQHHKPRLIALYGHDVQE